MNSKLINELIEKNYIQFQFRLSHKILGKKSLEWEEVDHEPLTISEWEDLKEICLNEDDKRNLEMKGFAKGILKYKKRQMVYSFTEWKQCFKAFFAILDDFNAAALLQSQFYWDELRKPSGLHLVVGQNGSGRSQFISEILKNVKSDSPQISAIHSNSTTLNFIDDETVLQLGSESIDWSPSHEVYDGVNRVFVDLNEIENWEKWIKLSEAGFWVMLSLNSRSLENALNQVFSSFHSSSKAHWSRFCQSLSSLLFMQAIPSKKTAVFECLVLNKKYQTILEKGFDREVFSQISSQNSVYLSLNQSIIQALVKRQLDVQTAFQISQDPVELDQLLKKMGL